MRLLIVEDEETIVKSLERGLKRRGFAVDIALNGQIGLDKAAENPYDVIVLDRDLPVVHGDVVCRQLVASDSEARILMLTASGGTRERVSGLNLGADDYLAKPFDFDELVARLHALGRRLAVAPVMVLRGRGIELNKETLVTTRDGVFVDVTATERRVLAALLRADGAVVAAETLIEQCWDEHLDALSNVVAVTIGRLRRKLGAPQLIETITGAGYRL